MPERADTVDRDPPELGALLELLHRADESFSTVRATYRIWRHNERAAAASRAEIDDQKRRGASIVTVGLPSETPVPAERDEIVRIWRAGERVREERDGGGRDGFYGVRAGDLWWFWDPRMGASSNENEPTVASGIGEELSVMLDPTPLLGSLKFAAAGRSEVAGRPTIIAQAAPRWFDARRGPRSFELHQLGAGADRYTLQVDVDRGVLLEVVALRGGEPFHKITTVDTTFDRPIPDERFRFEPPAGEHVRPVGARTRPQRLPLPEAQQRAPFTILIPDRIPAGWHVHCVFVEPSDRPPSPAQVALNYSSDDGHESFSLSESSASERDSVFEELTRGEGWEEVIRDGTVVRVTKPASRGPQVQAHLECDGTFVFLMSETLNGDQLATIAGGLKPAPSTSNI